MFTLIADTPDFVVVDKKSGFSFHNNPDETGFFNGVKSVLNLPELYPVHRLDRMTSGILILAKNRHTAAAMGELFASRKISKYYVALSDKKPSKKMGTVRGDMTRARDGAWRLTRGTENPAVTKFISTHLDNGLYLFVIKPLTGRTHQIRVAMKSLGSPILGDPVYGGSPADRGYLHSFLISFTLENVDYCYKSLPSEGEKFIDDGLINILSRFDDDADSQFSLGLKL